MQQDIVTDVDLAKNVFEVHAIDVDGKVMTRRQLRRAEVLKFFSSLAWKRVHRRIIGDGG